MNGIKNEQTISNLHTHKKKKNLCKCTKLKFKSVGLQVQSIELCLNVIMYLPVFLYGIRGKKAYIKFNFNSAI